MSEQKRVVLSRRTVLKAGAVLGAALAVGVPLNVKKASAAGESTAKKQLGFSYDQKLCIGCGLCVKTCQETNKWEEGTEWRKLYTKEDGDKKVFLSMSCNHCEKCACMKVCPVKAYKKRDDGIVVHDPEVCVGCGYCLYACPYHAPHLSEESGAVFKCHMCYKRQDEGKKPACVEICPMKALGYGDMAELSKLANGTAEPNGLPTSKITNPSFVVVPK